jgi:hypothetical protein
LPNEVYGKFGMEYIYKDIIFFESGIRANKEFRKLNDFITLAAIYSKVAMIKQAQIK